MISNDRINRRGRASFTADALDLRVMELLAEDGSLSYKQLAEKLKVDKRTVSKHLEALKRNGAVRITAEIDWSLIGVNAFAFVGTMTALLSRPRPRPPDTEGGGTQEARAADGGPLDGHRLYQDQGKGLCRLPFLPAQEARTSIAEERC